MRGKRAARLGDTALTCGDPVDTPTGVVVAGGTVFINQKPAAKQGDRIVGSDIHTVLLPGEDGPLSSPLPHPFDGIIENETVSNVRIEGKPAAVVGSSARNIPPHIPMGGTFQTPPQNLARIKSGSPNVFIGSETADDFIPTAVLNSPDGIFPPISPYKEDEFDWEGHYLDASFIDGGNNSVLGCGYTLRDTHNRTVDGLLNGPLRRHRVKPGEAEVALFDISRVFWEADGLSCGTTAELHVHTTGVRDGTPLTIDIYEQNATQKDRRVARIQSERIIKNEACANWTYPATKRSGDGCLEQGADLNPPYRAAVYYFIANVAGKTKRSAPLEFEDDVFFELKCIHNKPLKNVQFVARLANGEARAGRTDDKGRAKIGKASPENVTVTFYGLESLIDACGKGQHNGDCPIPQRLRLDETITDLSWEKESAKFGDTVKMDAKAALADGTPVVLTVFEDGGGFADDIIAQINTQVHDRRIEGEWTFAYDQNRYHTPTLADLKSGDTPYYYFTVTSKEGLFGVNRESGPLRLTYKPPKQTIVLEVEDVLFNRDSAALMPEALPSPDGEAPKTVSGIDTIVTIFQYLMSRDFRDKKLLIMAHTAPNAENAHNLTLSEARAQSIYYLLTGDRDKWVETVESRRDVQKSEYRNEDLRRILRFINDISDIYDRTDEKWRCDPKKVDGSPFDAEIRDAIANFRTGFSDAFPGSYQAPASGPVYWGWAAEGDDPGFGAVFDVFQAEIERRIAPYKINQCREQLKRALSWNDTRDEQNTPYIAIGCGEERPLNKNGDEKRQCRTNARIEVLFFDGHDTDDMILPCSRENRRHNYCNSRHCPIWGNTYGIKNVEMTYIHEPLKVTSPRFYCPKIPGSRRYIPINNLYLYDATFDARGKLDIITLFRLKKGYLYNSTGEYLRTIQSGPGHYFYFSNRGDLVQFDQWGNVKMAEASKRFAKDGPLPLQGPITVAPSSETDCDCTIWDQNDWILFDAVPINDASPDQVMLADGFGHYQLGEAVTEQQSRWRPFDKREEKMRQERWMGDPEKLLPLACIGEIEEETPRFVATMSARHKNVHELKLITVGQDGEHRRHLSTVNGIVPENENIHLVGRHTFNKDLTELLENLDFKSGDKAIDALQDPPEKAMLRGDIPWFRGERDLSGPLSAAACLLYWLPYTARWESEAAGVVQLKESFLADFPLNEPQGGQNLEMFETGMKTFAPVFYNPAVPLDSMDKDHALKLIKLYILAGVPVIIGIEATEARFPLAQRPDPIEESPISHAPENRAEEEGTNTPAASENEGNSVKSKENIDSSEYPNKEQAAPFAKMAFQVLVGYDGPRLFTQQVTQIPEGPLPNQQGTVDLSTAPIGNGVVIVDEFWNEIKDAKQTSFIEGCHAAFIPIYPKNRPPFQRFDGVQHRRRSHLLGAGQKTAGYSQEDEHRDLYNYRDLNRQEFDILDAAMEMIKPIERRYPLMRALESVPIYRTEPGGCINAHHVNKRVVIDEQEIFLIGTHTFESPLTLALALLTLFQKATTGFHLRDTDRMGKEREDADEIIKKQWRHMVSLLSLPIEQLAILLEEPDLDEKHLPKQSVRAYRRDDTLFHKLDVPAWEAEEEEPVEKNWPGWPKSRESDVPDEPTGRKSLF